MLLNKIIGQEQNIPGTHIWGIHVILEDTLNDTKVNIICNLRQMYIILQYFGLLKC